MGLTRRGPFCRDCGEPIKPCAPCCRHSGWLHKATGKHECGGAEGSAFPATVTSGEKVWWR
jgi:hypothetical protein